MNLIARLRELLERLRNDEESAAPDFPDEFDYLGISEDDDRQSMIDAVEAEIGGMEADGDDGEAGEGNGEE